MDAIVERCCGLDVHQASITACLLTGSPSTKPNGTIRVFGTTRKELSALKEWLLSDGCTHVAMESTGIYWMPVFATLEDAFALVVGNATHIKNVPGRKTDVKDAEWIADLLRHGLIRPSFVPPKPFRELRELLRYRRSLIEARTSERNRLHKLLEMAGIKLSVVVSDIFGATGKDILRALLGGGRTAEEMAQLARGRLRSKIEALEQALDGGIQEHHRFVLGLQLDQLEQVEKTLAKLDAQLSGRMAPYRRQMALLMQIPGVDRITAMIIIAELGIDMSVFPTVHHAAAWAGVCPGNNESAGKRKGHGARKGNVHLMTALVQAAVAASRKKGTYLKGKYWRLKSRRGPKRAALAIAHKILIAAYHMLKDDVEYKDLGEAYLDRVHLARTRTQLVRRLEQMGYEVVLTKKTA